MLVWFYTCVLARRYSTDSSCSNLSTHLLCFAVGSRGSQGETRTYRDSQEETQAALWDWKGNCLHFQIILLTLGNGIRVVRMKSMKAVKWDYPRVQKMVNFFTRHRSRFKWNLTCRVLSSRLNTLIRSCVETSRLKYCGNPNCSFWSCLVVPLSFCKVSVYLYIS